MEWTERKIKALSSKDYLKYRKEIREYYSNHRPVIKDDDFEEKKKPLKVFKLHKAGKRSQSSKLKKLKNSEILELILFADSAAEILTQKELFDCWNKEREQKTYYDGRKCDSCGDFKKWKDFYFNKKICNDCINFKLRLKRYININHRLACNLRNRIRNVLKGKTKSAKTLQLLGCSVDFLRGYLEVRFKAGMSWDNYGKKGWEVDHIVPCCSFDLSKLEEQRECFHYTNLQPLWAKENAKKGGKF